MDCAASDRDEDRIIQLLCAVQLPLSNMEFVVGQFLLANATRLDPETRRLLAGVRDGVGRIAASSRRIAEGRDEAAGPADASSDAADAAAEAGSGRPVTEAA